MISHEKSDGYSYVDFSKNKLRDICIPTSMRVRLSTLRRMIREALAGLELLPGQRTCPECDGHGCTACDDTGLASVGKARGVVPPRC